jgi:hypothetical protein
MVEDLFVILLLSLPLGMSASYGCDLLTGLDKLSNIVDFLWCRRQVLAAAIDDEKVICMVLVYDLTP